MARAEGPAKLRRPTRYARLCQLREVGHRKLLGAFAGDSTSYLIGKRASGPLQRSVLSSDKWQRRLAAASRQLEKRGGPLLVTARFIPGGRTAITLSSGITERPYPWFGRWVAIATSIWATYAAGLGYFAGNRFKDDHTTAFFVAFGTALTATVLIEVVRWLRERRSDPPMPAVD